MVGEDELSLKDVGINMFGSGLGPVDEGKVRELLTSEGIEPDATPTLVADLMLMATRARELIQLLPHNAKS